MTLKYFFYHQIFFQDSAQTEKLTVFSNPKYTAWTFWNTEHEHFEILSMKLNCKYWECMDWNPRNTDVPASVFRRYCDTLLYTAQSQHAEIENSHSQRGKSEQALLKLYSNFLALPAHEFRVEVRVFNWGLLGELWYIISTTNIWVSVLGYVKNNIIQIFFFIWRKYYCLQLFYILLFSLIF